MFLLRMVKGLFWYHGQSWVNFFFTCCIFLFPRKSVDLSFFLFFLNFLSLEKSGLAHTKRGFMLCFLVENK